jgi:hypothetical protein
MLKLVESERKDPTGRVSTPKTSARLRADFRSFPFGVYRAHFLEKTN